MPRVVHFEIPADDPARAVKFYEEVFAWEISKWDAPVDYWLITTGEEGEPGIDGAITPREEVQSTTNTISVPNVDEFAQKVRDAGGQVVTERMTIPGFGYFHYCLDTEGNLFGIMQSDPDAQQA
jgi:predicted enzyme related to lactoylglutathione lyase